MKNFLRIFSVVILITCFFAQGIDAREIIPSTAATLEDVQTETFAEVEAARGHETENVQAEAAILADPITKNVIYEKNADARMYPASTTKLMSFVVAMEKINAGEISLEDKVTISEAVEAIDEGDIGLKAGEIYTLNDLLMAMSIISANDASLAVAEYIGGSESQYVEMMNSKAAALGMSNTHYVNCNGLHNDDHYTTARDLLTLSIYAVDVPGLLTLTSAVSYNFPLNGGQKAISNTNRLLIWYEGTDGLKTGFTTPAGYCLTATAVRDDMRLIAVVLGCNKQYSHYSEAMKLLNYGFDNYAMAEAVSGSTVLSKVTLPKGKVEEVGVMAEEAITLPTAKSGDPGYDIIYETDSDLTAPVAKGDVIGTVKVEANGEIIAETPMLAAESVDKENIFQTVYRFFRDLIRRVTT